MILALSGQAPASPIDSFNGLPTHPLIVHFAVGLVLLAAIGGIVSVVPRWRSWALPTSVVVSVLALGSALVATETGEGLERRVQRTDLLEAHAEAGEMTRNLTFVLMVLLVGWWWVERALQRAAAEGSHEALPAPGAGRRATAVDTRTAPAGLRIGATVLSIVTVLVSVATAYMLYLAGDRGAKTVWGNLPAASTSAPEAPAGS